VTIVALVLGVALAAAAVVLVALPFLREPEVADDRLDAPSEADQRRLELVEARDQALAALKELEFDHRTGKIGDEDYRQLVTPLRQAAAAALQALDAEERYGPGMAAFEPPETVPEPAPPPDEGTPPTPAPVPEPYPPPDEGTPPRPPAVPEPGPQE
jgi:hypothetical protein